MLDQLINLKTEAVGSGTKDLIDEREKLVEANHCEKVWLAEFAFSSTQRFDMMPKFRTSISVFR